MVDQVTETTRSVTQDLASARKMVRESVFTIGKEQAGIINAFGRTLADTITADAPVPAGNTAATDGYAARSSDTSGATDKDPRRLSVLADSPARISRIDTGTVVCVKVGDLLPEGADTVIERGRTYRPHDGPEIMVLAEISRGANIHPAGARVSEGEVLIEQGTFVSGKEMGLLASIGRHGICVSRKPRIAIITTGSSVIEIVEELKPGYVRNSARYQLVGMVLDSGCEIGKLIHTKEGRISLEKAICDCTSADAIIVAISSQDKHDTAVAALANVGSAYFERVHMEPGAATAFGMVEGIPVFITPQDAVLETFECIIRPGLLTLLGRSIVDRPTVQATTQLPLKLNPGYTHCIKAQTTYEDGHYITNPLLPRTPNVRPWMLPNSLIVVPPDAETVKRGETVDVMMIE